MPRKIKPTEVEHRFTHFLISLMESLARFQGWNDPTSRPEAVIVGRDEVERVFLLIHSDYQHAACSLANVRASQNEFRVDAKLWREANAKAATARYNWHSDDGTVSAWLDVRDNCCDVKYFDSDPPQHGHGGRICGELKRQYGVLNIIDIDAQAEVFWFKMAKRGLVDTP